MLCPNCNGRGAVEEPIYNSSHTLIKSWKTVKCEICGGKGEFDAFKPKTNEEWFTSLSTEEKAKWIERIMFIVRYREEVENGAYMQTITKKDYIEKWLKQPHTNE